MLKNIQTLRFLAAFWVVLHHMSPPVTPFTLSLLPESISKLGFAGVDIFFVISGLIMAETTRGLPAGWTTALPFLVKRFGRVYIGWWPLFVIYFLGTYLQGRLREQVDLWGSFFLWPQDLMLNLLPITWTLSFELYFYLVVALLVAWNRSKASLVLGMCGIAIFVLNILFYQRGLYLPVNEAQAKTNLLIPFYLSPLILEFISGFLLSEWFHRFPKQCLGCWLAGATATIILAFCYQTYAPLHASGLAGFFHVGERAVLLGGFACCLVACAMELERRNIFSWKFFQALGDASYSIYLSHIICLIVVASIFQKLEQKLHLPSISWGLIAIALTFACSWFYYQLVERPLNIRLKNQLTKLVGLQKAEVREA